MSEKDINNLKEMLVDFNEYSTDYTKTRCRELEETIENTLKEIERLNNIINQLEKELKDDYKIWMCNSRSNGKSVKFGIDVCKMHFYNRLQELKGSDKE